MTVIYKIVNLVNNKFYVGSAIDYNRRLREHKSMLLNNVHTNPHLQNSYNKYGKDSFIFEILEVCNAENLIIREQFYIEKLNPQYNILKVAGNSLGYKHTKDSLHKMSVSKLGNKHCVGRILSLETKERMAKAKFIKVGQYDLKGNFIDDFNSIKQASEHTGIPKHCIRDCCSGKTKTGKGYIWKKL